MKYLKNLRTKAGLSQREVSDHFGWTTAQFVSNWERGVSQPPIRVLTRLAALYKIERTALVKNLMRVKIREKIQEIKKEFR